MVERVHGLLRPLEDQVFRVDQQLQFVLYIHYVSLISNICQYILCSYHTTNSSYCQGDYKSKKIYDEECIARTVKTAKKKGITQ